MFTHITNINPALIIVIIHDPNVRMLMVTEKPQRKCKEGRKKCAKEGRN
jgi:hypothetical protein